MLGLSWLRVPKVAHLALAATLVIVLAGPLSSPAPAAAASPALGQPQVTLGFDFGCAVLTGGAVQCWGANNYGQLGDGTTTARLSPVLVPGVGGAIAVSATQGGACALLSSGAVKCWGWDGVTVRPVPGTIAGISGAVGITSGEAHTCVLLAGGAAKCWGQNQYGPLGDGTTAQRAEPVTVVGLSGVAQISAAGQTTCALLASGGVVCWGAPQSGAFVAQVTPVAVTGVSGAIAIGTGRNQGSCAVIAGGSVQCWGAAYSPGPVTMDGISGATAVVAGGLEDNYCAILAGGTVACWGRNNYGQLGDGTTIDRYRTPVMAAGLSGVAWVAIGVGWTTCGAKASGEFLCWGFNGNGELGNGTTTNSSTPVPVTSARPGPTLTLPADLTLVTTSPSGLAVAFSATAADYPSGAPLVVTCSPGSGTVFPIGWTTVTCTATGSGGESARASFSVHVMTAPPAVTASSDLTREATSLAGATVTFTASARDAFATALAVTCAPASATVFPMGSTLVTCRAVDAWGTEGSARFSVTVRDTTPPAASLPSTVRLPGGGGQGYLAEATSAAGAATFSGGTVADPIDGSLPVTCRATDGSVFPLGTSAKPITCIATDSSGNVGSAASGTPRTVLVRDATAPTIAAQDLTVEAQSRTGATVSFDIATSDAVDGAGAASCTPASGTLFAVGSTTVTCRAADRAGNSAVKTFTVAVVDSTPPDDFAFPAGSFSAEATSPAGAVSFSGGSANDLVDGAVPVLCRPVSGEILPFGVSTWNGRGARQLECSATDSHGNPSSQVQPFRRSVTVTVRDTTAPEAVVTLDPATGKLVVTGTDAGSGPVAGPVMPTCAPEAKKAKDDDHDVGDKDDKDNQTQLCTYLLGDNAGNITTLAVRVRQSGKELKASAVSIQYGSAPVTTLPANSLSFEWSTNKEGSLKELNQKLSTGKGKTKVDVEAKYHDGKSEVTRIRADLPGNGQDVKTTVSGLDLLRLTTANGVIAIAY